SRAAEAIAWRRGLAARPQPRARRQDRQSRGRSADAGPCRASLADHDGQARRRSAELRVVQAGSGQKVMSALLPDAARATVFPERGVTTASGCARSRLRNRTWVFPELGKYAYPTRQQPTWMLGAPE